MLQEVILELFCYITSPPIQGLPGPSLKKGVDLLMSTLGASDSNWLVHDWNVETRVIEDELDVGQR